MITMNRVIPIIGGLVVVIAVAVALKSGERKPKPDMLSDLPRAASPDVDTPADTVRSLSAQVAQMVDQTKRLTEENQKLREQNATALDQEKRVAEKVRAELAQDIDRAGRRDDQTLNALSQQLEKLRGRLANVQPPAPAPGDMPVGFGYDGTTTTGTIHWINGLDAPAAGPTDEGSTFAPVPGSSLLHPNIPGGKPAGDPSLVNAVAANAGQGGGRAGVHDPRQCHPDPIDRLQCPDRARAGRWPGTRPDAVQGAHRCGKPRRQRPPDPRPRGHGHVGYRGGRLDALVCAWLDPVGHLHL